MLYHQMSVFYLPLIAIIALRACSRRQLLSRLALFVACSFGLPAAVYLAVMVFYYRLTSINSWWAFLTSDTQQSGVWGSYNPWAYWKGLGYLLNSGSYAFSIENPHGDELAWMTISRALSWVLPGVVVAISVVRAFKSEWLGVVAGGILLATMTFINWWEAPTTDYWVFPWMLVLLLLAWVCRGRLATVLGIWLIFYIPAQFTVNWHYKMAVMTDPDADLKDRIITAMFDRVTAGKVILLTDDGNLALRLEMAGVHAILFPRQFGSCSDAAGIFISRFINPLSRGYDFIVSDALFSSYEMNIKPYVPQQYRTMVDAAFANAVPLADVSNRWGFELRLWKLSH